MKRATVTVAQLRTAKAKLANVYGSDRGSCLEVVKWLSEEIERRGGSSRFVQAAGKEKFDPQTGQFLRRVEEAQAVARTNEELSRG